ncbi:MAG: hypothetical protein AAGB34_05915 [Planctomycetota bacterium]
MHHEHLILCALAIEASWVRRLLPRESVRARILQTGPGPDNAERVLDEIDLTVYTSVTLFGVAGGLAAPAGTVVVPSRVINEAGEEWEIEGGDEGITLLGADRILRSVEEKHAVLQATSAHAVDMESHAVAKLAMARGIPVRIIRGISDGPNDTLPAGVERWTKANGGLSFVPLLTDIARKRVSIRELRQLQRNTAKALNAAGSRLAKMLR